MVESCRDLCWNLGATHLFINELENRINGEVTNLVADTHLVWI